MNGQGNIWRWALRTSAITSVAPSDSRRSAGTVAGCSDPMRTRTALFGEANCLAGQKVELAPCGPGHMVAYVHARDICGSGIHNFLHAGLRLLKVRPREPLPGPPNDGGTPAQTARGIPVASSEGPGARGHPQNSGCRGSPAGLPRVSSSWNMNRADTPA